MEQFFNFIHLGFCVSVVLCSWMVIKIIDDFSPKPLGDKTKKACTYIVGIVLYNMYSADGTIEHSTLVTSYICATALYDFIIKNILKKTNLKYKDSDNDIFPNGE